VDTAFHHQARTATSAPTLEDRPVSSALSTSPVPDSAIAVSSCMPCCRRSNACRSSAFSASSSFSRSSYDAAQRRGPSAYRPEVRFVRSVSSAGQSEHRVVMPAVRTQRTASFS